MADKQATVYVVDMGQSMGDAHSGRVESDLNFGMRYVWEKIAQTLAASRAGLLVGVVGFRNDQTDHILDPTEYSNIWAIKPLERIDMSHLKDLQRKVVPSHTDDGDAVSAVVVAIEMIQQATTLKSGLPGKYKRTIVVLTNGEGQIDSDGLEDIASKIKEVNIELKVIGVDFDDKDYGFKEEDKSELKREIEATLKDLVEQCDGTFGTAAEAVESLSIPEVKTTKPWKTYGGKLSLGDWNNPDYEQTALYIDVIRYFKTKQRKPESATNFVDRSVNGTTSAKSSHTVDGDIDMDDAPAHGNGDDIARVQQQVVYRLPGVMKEGSDENVVVPRDELARGYEYGRTVVPISASEENVTKLETFEEFTIIGFIPWDKYERYLNMGETCITVALATNDKARMALSSFIHSLHELESYAVARLAVKNDKDPQIVLLAPMIEPDIEALIDVPLPFAEDVRLYRFPPLDRVITTSGATVKTHRNLPNDDLVDAMSNYVDSMDLSKFGRDDNGDPTEYMPIEETYSPVVHRTNQAIRRRATHPEEPVAKAAGILTKFSEPPPDLATKAEPYLEALKKAADVKKVPEKVKGRGKRATITPLSGLPLDDLLKRREVISKDNTVADFKQMLDAADGTDNTGVLSNATDQMGQIIRDLLEEEITGAGRNTSFDRALENVRVMREEMIAYEEPEMYNKFIHTLKRDMVGGKFGEDRKKLWTHFRIEKLGLIDSESAAASEVSPEEAEVFFMTNGMSLAHRSK